MFQFQKQGYCCSKAKVSFVFKKKEQIRVAFVFQLVDWSPEAIAVFNTTFEEGVPSSFIEQYSAVLGSIDLIRYEGGQRKAVWERVLNWVEMLK